MAPKAERKVSTTKLQLNVEFQDLIGTGHLIETMKKKGN